MGSANKQYPVAIQAKLPMSSSVQSSRPFKPPSKLREKATELERVDGALQDEELMNLYSTGTEQKPEAVESSIAITSKPSLSK